eukprot:TRINITY_DN2891_c0_g1_i1.p1 TRINITY_DN2891_c0_g1~~TRINITY_DN2891_c0_g1_i1.p1  ORF type:complete len:247 (+),score=92.64 TRINITY_DN2891_c0_g1_i1:93-833(+)
MVRTMDQTKDDVQSAAIDRSKLKTKICRHWLEGYCPFGGRCAFAHGDYELMAGQQGEPYCHPAAPHGGRQGGRRRRDTNGNKGPATVVPPAAAAAVPTPLAMGDLQYPQGGSLPITMPAGGKLRTPQQAALGVAITEVDSPTTGMAMTPETREGGVSNHSFRTLSSSSCPASLQSSFFRYEPYSYSDEVVTEVLQVPAEDPALRAASPPSQDDGLSDSTNPRTKTQRSDSPCSQQTHDDEEREDEA